MSRKDYVRLARVLETNRPQDIEGPLYRQWITDVNAIADALGDNTRFDRGRFLDATHGLWTAKERA